MAGGNRTLKLSLLADVTDLAKGLKSADNDVETFGDKLGKFGKVAGAAFLAAGAAAATYATKLAVDGVKAAIEDEAAQAKLAKTLQNVTGATDAQIKATEAYIDAMAAQFGVADDQLRPSLDRLVRSTGDLTEAQKLQKLALDLSAGAGVSLEQATNALAKANEGNFGALKKLGVPLDENIVKTKDFDAATKVLSETFNGQAAIAADTFQGKLARIRIGFDEAKESLGAALLPILERAAAFIADIVVPAFTAFIAALTGEEGTEKAVRRTGARVDDFNSNTLSPTEQAAQQLAYALRELAAAFNGVDETGKKVSDPAAGLRKTLNVITAIVSAIERLVNILKTAAKAFDDFAKAQSNAIGNAANAVRGVFGLEPRSVPGRATGGPVSSNQPYVVGERGPELFIPRNSGTIIPNGAGAQTVNITVNGAIDPEGVARAINRVLNQSQRRVGTAVA